MSRVGEFFELASQLQNKPARIAEGRNSVLFYSIEVKASASAPSTLQENIASVGGVDRAVPKHRESNGMIPILNAATKVMSLVTGKPKDESTALRNTMIKQKLGLADQSIPIGRELEPTINFRWKVAVNDVSNNGQIQVDPETVLRWREFRWTTPASIDDCNWQDLRWRFYENGLVCFDARMSNTSGNLDNGDVQGHRIEIRERNGLLIGVWLVGFFVRKDFPARGFHASVVDEHLPLKYHFDELNDEQTGACICL